MKVSETCRRDDMGEYISSHCRSRPHETAPIAFLPSHPESSASKLLQLGNVPPL